MSRPKKQTVDYFPHDCVHNKTMFILEQKYGNDGYAFWFKVLETLGSAEGHYIHFVNGVDWEFLMAKTRLGKDKCNEMLDLLATLGAIDKDLWHEEQIVWSNNFVERVKDAYRNRTVDIPNKPSFLRKKSASEGVDNVRNPQTKLKETKGNNIIAPTFVPKSEQPPKINYNFSTNKWDNVTQEDWDLWAIAYPACDLKIEFAKMKAWILGAGAKGHKKNWLAFITRWLSNSQDKGGSDVNGNNKGFVKRY